MAIWLFWNVLLILPSSVASSKAPLFSSTSSSIRLNNASTNDAVDLLFQGHSLSSKSSSSNNNNWNLSPLVGDSPPSTHQHHHQQQHRILDNGDFDELNQLLKNVQIRWPQEEITAKDDIVTVSLWNTVCFDFSIQDMQWQHAPLAQSTTTSLTTTTTTRLTLSLQGLDFSCTLDYRYSFLFTRSGTASLDSFGNEATLTMDIVVVRRNDDDNNPDVVEHDSNHTAVTYSTQLLPVTNCDPTVQITDLQITSGDISSVVWDAVLRLLRNQLEEQAAQWICRQWQDYATTTVNPGLQNVDSTMAQYIHSVVDFLSSQQDLDQPPSMVEEEEEEDVSLMTLLNFQQEQGLFAVREWVRQVLLRAVAYLMQPVGELDADSSNSTAAPTDIQVNAMLREHVLDADGGYRIALNNTVYDGTDRLTHTRVVLERIHIFGLDTVTALTPLEAIGPQTLQMQELALEYLRFDLDVFLDIQPSTRTDSLIVNGDSDSSSLQESVKIQFSLSNVQIRVSLLMALNQDLLGSLTLGQLLHSDRIVACFLSTLYALEVGGLSVHVGDVVEPPILVGFVSPGTDRIVSSAVDAAFAVYQDALLEALPGLFHIEVRQRVNQYLASKLVVLQLDHQGQCAATDFNHSEDNSKSGDAGAFIDFRDLLLPPEQAVATGGSGTQPYGDLVSRTWQELQRRWIVAGENDDDGSPGINKLIQSFIEERYSRELLTAENINNTNVDSVLYLDNVVLSSNSTLKIAGLEAQVLLQLQNVRVNNLASFGNPLRILNPMVGSPHTLHTMVSIGTNSKDLGLSAKLVLSISDDKELNIRNEVAIHLDLDTASVVLDMLVQILETSFLSVPLNDTLNANCWIASVLPPQSSFSTERGEVQIVRQEIEAESLFVNFSCTACSSPNFEELAYELYSPDRSGNATATLLNLLELFKQSKYLESLNGGVVELAAKQCPHNPDYDPDASYSELFRAGEAGSLLVEPNRDQRAHVFNVVSALIAICSTVLYVAGRRMANRSFTSWKESASEDTLEQLRVQESREIEDEAELNSCAESMFRSPTLLPRERFGFPAALVLTICLQLCGHLALLSTVTLSGQVAGEPFVVRNFLEFYFFSALRGAGGNGGPEMAVLAFVFTGIWPYVKLVTSLALWFSPPHKISVFRRGSILLWLDVFAKLSVVDIITILFAVGAFLVYFGGLDQSLHAEGEFFAIKAIVQPGLGFYTIVMAQRILRITSRFMLDCHQRIIAGAVADFAARRVTFVATASSSWDFPDDGDDDASYSRSSSDSGNEGKACKVELGEDREPRPVRPSREQPRHSQCRINFLTVFAGMTVVLVGMIGAFLAPAMSIDTKAVWLIVGSGRTYAEAVSDLAVFEVITEILLQSRVVLDSVADYIGLGFLLFLVVAASTAFPLMKAAAKFRKWTRSLRYMQRAYPSSRSSARGTVSLRTSLVRKASASFSGIQSACKLVHTRWRLRRTRSQSSEGAGAIELLPFYRIKAWRQTEVYLSAFIVACWQLGAVAAYTIHLYCYFMEMIYKSLENLGFLQSTSAQCFRNQLMEASTLAVVCVGFLVLLGSSVFAAKSHFDRIIRSAHCD